MGVEIAIKKIGAYGPRIRVQAIHPVSFEVIDLTGTTGHKINFRHVDSATVVIETAILENDEAGDPTFIVYQLTSGDLDTVGIWFFEGEYTRAGAPYKTDNGQILVKAL